jgi:hypothetical protein
MDFSCTAKYGVQHRITIVMHYRKVIGAAISTMEPDCLSRDTLTANSLASHLAEDISLA